jgi:hypothetical protein
LQARFKANTPTTKNYSLSLDGFYNDDQYFTLNANGIVLIKLYLDVGYPEFQEFALSVLPSASSGLATSTQYYFKIAFDGGAVVEYDITTASDVTWNAIVALIQTEISAVGKCTFVGGDVRISSLTESFSSAVSCSNGTSGTNLFGSGSVPATASLQTSTPEGFYCYGVSSQTITCTPHEVVRESLSFDCSGGLEYFTS